MSYFSDKISSLRNAHGWSKTYVANLLGISVQRYANYEYGTREPDLSLIKKIADVFETSADQLIGNSNEPKDKKTVDIDRDPIVLSYDGKPVSKEDMEIIKAILARHHRNEQSD